MLVVFSNHQPSTINYQLSTINHQPFGFVRCVTVGKPDGRCFNARDLRNALPPQRTDSPSTNNHQLSTNNYQLSTIN
ncbi:MAG: hypothetical protein KME31_00710 [Tolypothrix carrinoi HA7290-LM1]|nr:hypothetical protein [Tolypothrix carrinoi HA7290-LM1]